MLRQSFKYANKLTSIVTNRNRIKVGPQKAIYTQIYTASIKRNTVNEYISTLTKEKITNNQQKLPKKLQEQYNEQPEIYHICRGCGTKFQCENPNDSGYVQIYHLSNYIDRVIMQIRAIKNNEQLKSGGGIGVDRETAALHASLEHSQRHSEFLNIDIDPIDHNYINNTSTDNDKNEQEIINEKEIIQIKNVIKDSARPLRCTRCYKCNTVSYISEQFDGIKPKDLYSILKDNLKDNKPCVILHVIDILDIHGTYIHNLKTIVDNNPIILCINKSDQLPKDQKRNIIEEWIKKQLYIYNKQYYTYIILSGKTTTNVDMVFRIAYSLARGKNHPSAPNNRNIYIIGKSNVGKSTLINSLLKRRFIGTGELSELSDVSKLSSIDNSNDPTNINDKNNQELINNNLIKNPILRDKYFNSGKYKQIHQEYLHKFNKVTTSYIPGTTLGCIQFPILHRKRGGKNVYVIDTPGVENEYPIIQSLKWDELRGIVPMNTIKPLSYNIKPKQSQMIGNLIRIDCISQKSNFQTCYFSFRTSITITSSKNITQEYLLNNVGTVIFPVYTKQRLEELNQYKRLSYKNRIYYNTIDDIKTNLMQLKPIYSTKKDISMWLDHEKNLLQKLQGDGWNNISHDIVFPGLGWISIVGVGDIYFYIITSIPLDQDILYKTIYIRDPIINNFTRKYLQQYSGTPNAVSTKAYLPLNTNTIVHNTKDNRTIDDNNNNNKQEETFFEEGDENIFTLQERQRLLYMYNKHNRIKNVDTINS